MGRAHIHGNPFSQIIFSARTEMFLEGFSLPFPDSKKLKMFRKASQQFTKVLRKLQSAGNSCLGGHHQRYEKAATAQPQAILGILSRILAGSCEILRDLARQSKILFPPRVCPEYQGMILPRLRRKHKILARKTRKKYRGHEGRPCERQLRRQLI